MNLKEIADCLLVKQTIGNIDIEITGLQMDSRKIDQGNLFICVPEIKGFLEDRHPFSKEAVRNGAVALILERDVDVDVPKIIVKDARYAMAVIASHFYDYPSNEMGLIGITGTNGKTTTSYILDKIFEDYGFITGVMGNNGVKMNGKVYPTDINTQEPPSLQSTLRKMRKCNTNYCTMEVSSQGLDMKRILGCNFKTAIFTNLTQDHIDYHGSFSDYRNAKSLLFSGLGTAYNPSERKYAVLNADDPSFNYFKKTTSVEIITYGINSTADVTAKNIKITSSGVHFLLTSFKGNIEIDLQLIGLFNVYNALAAITSALIEGIPLSSIRNSLSQLTNIEGRMEVVDEGQDYLVLVDYAHTPDGLENVLKTIKEFSIERVITVFGCGGDRDKSKRPLMGNIASNYSDFVVVTSDNPRSEDPIKIMNDIEKGMKKSSEYEILADREVAIGLAIQMASKHDVVLIAGKGHETYQILHDKTIQFNDKDIARRAILEI